MNINEVIKETTTSGAVATVAAPMSTQKRNNVGKGVYGNEKHGTLFTGKKTNKKYANSVKEDTITCPGNDKMFVKKLSSKEEVIEHVKKINEKRYMYEAIAPTYKRAYHVVSSSIFALADKTLTESKFVNAGRNFIRQMNKLDEFNTIKPRIGSKVAIISGQLQGNSVELWGFTVPKTITKIYREPSDGSIKQFEFDNDPGSVFPRIDNAEYDGTFLINSAFFGTEESANHALMLLMLHASGDIDVRNNVVTSEQSLSESQIFTSKQQVIDYFVKRGKPAKQGAAAWERGWRGPGSTTKKSNVPVVKKERSDWMYKWEKEQEDKMKSRELNEVQLEEEDKLIDPAKGKKRKTGLHGKNEESRLTGFKHPFKSSGDFVSDSRGNKVCECENSDLAKEVTKALNAYVKKDENVIPGSTSGGVIAGGGVGESSEKPEQFKKGQTVYLKTKTLPTTPPHGKVEKIGEKMIILSTFTGKYKAKLDNVTSDKTEGFHYKLYGKDALKNVLAN